MKMRANTLHVCPESIYTFLAALSDSMRNTNADEWLAVDTVAVDDREMKPLTDLVARRQ